MSCKLDTGNFKRDTDRKAFMALLEKGRIMQV